MRTQKVFINSKNRFNGSINDFNVVLPNNYLNDRHSDIYVSVLSFHIPKTWYDIDSTNNEVEVNSVSRFIPVGSYSITQLTTELNTLLSPEFSVSYNAPQGTFTFTNAAAHTLEPINSGLILGLVDGTVYSAASFSSSDPVRIYKYHTIYLRSNLLSSNQHLDSLSNEMKTSSVIASIDCDTAFLDLVKYDNSSPDYNRFHIENKNIERLNFSVVGEDNQLVDLSQDYSIELLFQFIPIEPLKHTELPPLVVEPRVETMDVVDKFLNKLSV